MAKDTKPKAKAPTGLTVKRNGKKFTLSWKVKDSDCTSQDLRYCVAKSFDKKGKPVFPTKTVKKGKKKDTVLDWTTKTGLKKKVTSKTFEWNNIAAIRFQVKCHAKKTKNKKEYKVETDWSDADYKYVIEAPSTPAIGVTNVNDLTATFAWETSNDSSSKKVFVSNECYQILATNCNTSNGDKVTGSWSKIDQPKASGGLTIQEHAINIATDSKTRWVKVKSKGWAGRASAWAYGRRVYAFPSSASDVRVTRKPFTGTTEGYSVAVVWHSPNTYARPIDSVTIEQTKVIPEVTVTRKTPDGASPYISMSIACPDTGLSWTSMLEVSGKSDSADNKRDDRQASFIDQEGIPDDNCYFVRVCNKHDNNVTPSIPTLPGSSAGYGALGKPSKPVAQPLGTPRLYSVSVSSRGTTIESAAIAVYFRTKSDQTAKCIGVIPSGATSTNCIIPEIASGDTFSFGVQAFIGNYTPDAAPSGSTTETIFTPTLTMSSEVVWGDEVPLPPSITLSAPNESTIEVEWTWSWTDATEAELSWADHDDAWNSTDEPQTYTVKNGNASVWRIAGLAVGTWYVRVRLLKPEGDSATYSEYSEMKDIKLASSPDTPSLLVSSGVVSKTDTITCYWAYVSGDGTGQRQAVVCEALMHYAPVELPTGNPFENLYYERTGESEETYKYSRSLDREVVSGKTYYQTTGEVTYGKEIPGGRVESAQSVTLRVAELGWLPGETHHLAVQVTSMSMEVSDGWSAPVPVTVAEEPYINITSTSLVYRNDIPSDFNDDGEIISYRSAFSLTQFPLTIDVEGASVGDLVTCIIDRAETYPMDRPDDSEYIGFEGETVLMKDYEPVDSCIEIVQEDMIGMFDDGATYSLTVMLSDAYGQTIDTTKIPTGAYNAIEDPIGNPQEKGWYILVDNNYILTTDTEPVSGTTYYEKEYLSTFEVHWAHQAVMPEAIVEIDREKNVTFITPQMPETGFGEGDVIDIYRLSADPPELIYSGALMTQGEGTKYVDPFPAFGEFGGHRIVYRTVNGDYITEQNELAYKDYTALDSDDYEHTTFGIIIDFGGEQVVLPYNVSFSNKWAKDFELTKYLGGSIQGDWNPAVERTMSAKTTIAIGEDPVDVEAIRRLAVYSGICHVRTPDGSSFAANIDVNDDREEKWTTQLAQISLDITRCDPEGQDAMTYEEWIKTQD